MRRDRNNIYKVYIIPEYLFYHQSLSLTTNMFKLVNQYTYGQPQVDLSKKKSICESTINVPIRLNEFKGRNAGRFTHFSVTWHLACNKCILREFMCEEESTAACICHPFEVMAWRSMLGYNRFVNKAYQESMIQ